MVLPDDLGKVLDLLVPQFLHLYNGNSNCTLMDCQTGEMSDHMGSLMHSRYSLLCSLTMFSSILRENLYGPFKKPGRNPGLKKNSNNKSAAYAVSFQVRQTVQN